EQRNGRQAPRKNVMPLFPVFVDKPPIKVVNKIRSSPVEMGQNGRGICGHQPANHQSDETDRQEFEHRGVSDVVAEKTWIEIWKRRLNVRQLRINDDGAERAQYPRPRSQDVMSDVEEQHGAQRIFL